MKRREFAKIFGKTAGGLFLAQFVPGCKNIFAPDPPPPGKSYDQIEFMYQRTLPIISPNHHDPSGMSIWNDAKGGFSVYGWLSVGPDQWTCARQLDYSQVPYYVCLIDMKVTGDYVGVARTLFARIQGQNDWIQLTSVEQNPQAGGEWAKFIFNKGVLSIPSSSSFSR